MKKTFWKNKRVLITGITGFVGSNLAKNLSNKEANVIGLTQSKKIESLLFYEKIDKKVNLISGDITETAEEYTKNNTGFRISLLNLDFDTYQGTKSALEAFFPYIAPGGIVVFDEYGKRGWGESDAVDEYFSNKEENIQAINDCFQPTAYIQKN